ncbi:MAG: arginase [Pasteurellaceae bacterium]|nr:arginase [Pasteurellaceae bacterium]
MQTTQTVNIVQILSDVGAGKRGTHLGVQWLCEQANLISPPEYIFVNQADSPFCQPPAKYIDNLTAFFQRFLQPLSEIYQQPAFPVILSGDHSNAIGTISALCHAYPDKRIGVIWIDAHADLHTPYTTPSGNIHGMTLAALIREDNQENAKQIVPVEVADYWQKLKQLAPQSAGILPQDLCFLGLRDYEPEERALLERWQIPHYSSEKMRQLGIEQVLHQVKTQFADLDMVYVSFDIDSLDSDLLSATGTPVAQGFSESELAEILAILLDLPNLAVFELTEFNPTLSADTAQYEMIYRLFDKALKQLQAWCVA